jgi:hypothetical protein
MKTEEMQKLVERAPFRPFMVRLSNGARYEFRDAKEVGAPGDCKVIFHFSANDWVMIDTASIVEVMPLPSPQ